MQLRIQEANSNAPLATAYVPISLYNRVRDPSKPEIWLQVTDQQQKVQHSMSDLVLENEILKLRPSYCRPIIAMPCLLSLQLICWRYRNI